MKRILVVVAAGLGALTIFGVQPVKADPQPNSSVGGWVTGVTNAALGDLPAPSGWQPRHICAGVDTINWGECITFPFPS